MKTERKTWIVLLCLLLLIKLPVVAGTPARGDISHYQKDIYGYFISGDMNGWKDIIGEMEKDYARAHDDALLKQIIFTLYGYIGYQVGMENHEVVDIYLDRMENYLEIAIEGNEAPEAWGYAMRAAAVGFRISQNRLMAPFIGKEAIESMQKAVEMDETEVMGWTEMGNSYLYRPPVFGGSSEKALGYYQRAISLLDANEKMRSYNWIYLNLHVLVAQCYIDQEQYDLALNTCEKVMHHEPSFMWVRNELLPEIHAIIEKKSSN